LDLLAGDGAGRGVAGTGGAGQHDPTPQCQRLAQRERVARSCSVSANSGSLGEGDAVECR
jgi:hypothetical protein